MHMLSLRNTLHASSASILMITSIITLWSDLMIIKYSLTHVAWWSRLNRSMSETFMIWTRQRMNWIQTLSSTLVIEISKCYHFFLHQDQYFEFSRFVKQIMKDSDFHEAESIQLICIECSSQSIKNLMKNCYNHYLNNEIALTVLRRSISKKNKEEHNMWQKVAMIF